LLEENQKRFLPAMPRYHQGRVQGRTAAEWDLKKHRFIGDVD